ncbi:hypothetical protein ACLM5H_10400 [Fredinandcohnia humi]
MNAKMVTSFASGLLLATSVCAIVYFVGPQEKISTKAPEKLSLEELQSLLSAEGYVAHTHAEWQELVEAKKTADDNKQATSEAESEKPATEEVVYQTVLTVSEGMTSIDVGKALVSANIIENALDFRSQVEKKGVEKYLKLGTYKITSNMTTDEIIATIFNK